MRLPRSLGVIIFVSVLACTKSASTPEPETAATESVAPKEAQEIAEEAYVYAYPMMENYRTMYVQAIDRTAPGHLAGFNQITHKTELLGPSFQDIVRPNNDTMYSFAWLELRAQPMVLTVPEIEDRYYSVQLVDMFTHNLGYVGTRATGGEGGRYMIAGPEWEGSPPDDVTAVFRSETSFVYCIVRIEVRGPDDVAAVHALQEGFAVTPLHLLLGHSRAPDASGVTFPRYDGSRAKSEEFIDLLGFLLADVAIVPSEEALMQRFARIGIKPGATAASLGLDPATADAIDAGVGQGLIAIREAAANPGQLQGVRVRAGDGWQGMDGIFGNGATMRSNYLARAAAAMAGIYGNDTIEAYYPIANEDAEGRPLDGSRHRYVMRFDDADRPRVDGFWSMTAYSLPEQHLVENPIGRYSIGDRSDLRIDDDGSLTIYIQREPPAEPLRSNWLPAPAGPFSLQFRMYLPKAEALDPLYLPPPVEAID